MFDSLFNVLVIIVALAVFIGRTVLQLRRQKKAPPQQQHKKQAPQQQKKQAKVFFEDAEDETYRDLAYFVELEEKKAKEAAAAKKKTTLKKIPNERVVKDTQITEPASIRVAPALATPTPAPVQAPVQASGLLNIRHLSPLKQAVVMAEVLGTPKGLQ